MKSNNGKFKLHITLSIGGHKDHTPTGTTSLGGLSTLTGRVSGDSYSQMVQNYSLS